MAGTAQDLSGSWGGLTWHAGVPSEPEGTDWEYGRSSCDERFAGAPVRFEPDLVPRKCFDASPRVFACDPGVEHAPGLPRTGAVVPVLGTDGRRANDPVTGILPLGGRVPLGGSNALLETRDEGRPRIGGQFGGEEERQRDRWRHVSVWTEEGLGPIGAQGFVGQGCAEGADAGPLACRLDQVIDDRIGEGVDHLSEDVLGLNELDRRGLFGGPHGLPPPVESVLVLCDQLVEMSQEVRKSP